MSEEKIKQYYERIEKLLNGANKETYGFAPEEIRQILKFYEVLQQENEQLKNNWNELKKWLNNFHKNSEFEQWEIVNKMQELEGSNE